MLHDMELHIPLSVCQNVTGRAVDALMLKGQGQEHWVCSAGIHSYCLSLMVNNEIQFIIYCFYRKS